MTVKNRLKHLREENNLTTDELSEKTNISYPTLRSYENGSRGGKEENWKILAAFFEVPVSYIMGLSDQRETIDEIAYEELLKKDEFKSTLESLNPDMKENVLKDLLGNPMYEIDENIFNLRVAKLDLVGSKVTNIKEDKNKQSENLFFYYFLKATDPTNNQFKFTVLNGLILTENISVDFKAKSQSVTIPVILSSPSENQTFNDLIDYNFRTEKIENLQQTQIIPNLVSSYLYIQNQIDKVNDNNDNRDKFLFFICNYTNKVLNNRFEAIDLTNEKLDIIFRINLFNQEYINITL